jgi:release factor glutamine methyltransferase
VNINLKSLYHIQKVLTEEGYFDISRISKEVLDHSIENKIPLEEILKRIKKNEPWEYIKGRTTFCGNEFLVNHHTLIPRIESEQLVSIATDLVSKNEYRGVIDVGTGSGCIIISLCKNLGEQNDIRFFATDIEKDALKIAKQNSVLHKVNKRISFLQTNLIKDLTIDFNNLIIANLPYIPSDMYKNLDKSVISFEPRSSLDGGKDGLKYYKELIKQINSKGIRNKYKTTLLVEIEPSTLDDLKKIVGNNITVIKDYRELDRFVLIHLS